MSIPRCTIPQQHLITSSQMIIPNEKEPVIIQPVEINAMIHQMITPNEEPDFTGIFTR